MINEFREYFLPFYQEDCRFHSLAKMMLKLYQKAE